jgi:hypothetical protein
LRVHATVLDGHRGCGAEDRADGENASDQQARAANPHASLIRGTV